MSGLTTLNCQMRPIEDQNRGVKEMKTNTLGLGSLLLSAIVGILVISIDWARVVLLWVGLSVVLLFSLYAILFCARHNFSLAMPAKTAAHLWIFVLIQFVTLVVGIYRLAAKGLTTWQLFAATTFCIFMIAVACLAISANRIFKD
jgi:hypothetical protein